MAGNYDDEQRVMDDITDEQRAGTTMVMIGSLLILFDLIPAVWLWVSWRSGSMFWFWWVLVEAVIGTGLLILGMMKRSDAARKAAECDRGESGRKAA